MSELHERNKSKKSLASYIQEKYRKFEKSPYSQISRNASSPIFDTDFPRNISRHDFSQAGLNVTQLSDEAIDTKSHIHEKFVTGSLAIPDFHKFRNQVITVYAESQKHLSSDTSDTLQVSICSVDGQQMYIDHQTVIGWDTCSEDYASSFDSLSISLGHHRHEADLYIKHTKQTKPDMVQDAADRHENQPNEYPSHDVSESLTNLHKLNEGETVPGDHPNEHLLTVMGIAKAVLYCLALKEIPKLLPEQIGHEPVGPTYHHFNLFPKLDPNGETRMIPYNPLVHSGALVICSLLIQKYENDPNTVFQMWCALFQEMTKETMVDSWDNNVDVRTLTIAYSLEDQKAITKGQAEPAAKLYERMSNCCTTMEAVAKFGALLANGGISVTDPLCSTEHLASKVVLPIRLAKDCLSMMLFCGMIKESGEWSCNVGLPSKSSKSGALLIVVPGLLGICLLSPAVDASGNSLRGMEFAKTMVNYFDFHLYDILPTMNLKKVDPRREPRRVHQEITQKLLYAAAEGDVLEIRRLKSRGAFLNSADYDHRTALHLAASEGKHEVVEYLVRQGCKIDAADRWGNTPLSDAIRNNHAYTAALLEAMQRNIAAHNNKAAIPCRIPQTASERALFYIVEHEKNVERKIEIMKSMVQENVDFNLCDENHNTLLHYSVKADDLTVAKFLLDKVNLLQKNHKDRTAASLAHHLGHFDILAVLEQAAEKKENELHLGENDLSHRSASNYHHFIKTTSVREGQPLRVHELLKILKDSGFRRDDNRFKKLYDRAYEIGEEGEISSEEFQQLSETGAILLERAVTESLVIPKFKQFSHKIEEIFESVRHVKSGHVASYIPQLANADPEKYAVAVCTVDGQQCLFGDVDHSFSIQSTSKPISYLAALEENGSKAVHQHVGREPSGLKFNNLSLMEQDGVKKPENPLINSGAIVCSSLIMKKKPLYERFDHMLKVYERLCGDEKMHFDNSTYLSEKSTADRNYCLAYMMREVKIFPSGADLEETLQLYLMQCSITGNVRKLATLAATLANGGVCPKTNERIYSAESVRDCLSIMSSCGLYDYSGEWGFYIGLPAKSGVSGVIYAVVPNVMGICIFSPRLDEKGNSVRAIEFFKKLEGTFGFHMLDSSLRRSYPENSSPILVPAVKHRLSEHFRLFYAAAEGELKWVKAMKFRGVDLGSVDYDGRTALHLAASEGHCQIVKYLVMNGVDIEPKDRWQGTPLSNAEFYGHQKIVKFLKAEIERRNKTFGVEHHQAESVEPMKKLDTKAIEKSD